MNTTDPIIRARFQNDSLLSQRHFLKSIAVYGAAASGLVSQAKVSAQGNASRRLRVGIMGLNGRGMAHVAGFGSIKDVEIAYVCDVDSRALEKASVAVQKSQSFAPKKVVDFRRMLDDKELDAVAIAAPNHWHAPAAILACSAGKHVYVEKPGSHTMQEAEWLIAAARKSGRHVQMGNQRRSWPWVIESINKVRSGEIGTVHYARGWYNALRLSIGRGKSIPVPSWLNFDLWQGPAPDRPYLDNLVHYNWHWRWHWGGGELENNGPHALDLARWGLGVDLPLKVTCSGARYHFGDDQETPDTSVVTYDYGTKGIEWNCMSCDPHGFEGEGFGVTFYGDKGTLIITGNQCRIYDLKRKLLSEIKGNWDDNAHFANFVDAIRDGKTLNSPIEDAQKSTMLCHLGNVSYRAGKTIGFDPGTRRLVNAGDARKFWKREYRKGWVPKP